MNKPEIAIVGIGITKQAKSIDTSTIQICEEAVQKALDDAGMDMAEVDGIAARWPGPGGTELDPGVVDWTGIFGKPFRWVGVIPIHKEYLDYWMRLLQSLLAYVMWL